MRKTRVLLLGSPLYGYYKSVVKAFQANNCEVNQRAYLKPKLVFKIPLIGPFLENLVKRVIGQVHFWHIMLNHKRYDILLFFGYYLLTPGQIKRVKSTTKIKTVFWAFDSIHAKKNGYAKITACDYIFCYNMEDELELKRDGYYARFIPLCYDEKKYYKIPNLEYQNDIYFIGALRSRIAFLEEYLAKIRHFDYKIQIDGKLSPLFLFKNKKKYPTFFKHYSGKKKNSEEISRIYNSSRICLNIQPTQATSGFSIRTFEICGAGSLMLSNGNLELLREYLIDGKHYVYYKSIDELVESTNKILSNYHEYSFIRNNAYERASNEHTYSNRVNFILSQII